MSCSGTQCPRPGFKPGPLAAESSALTIRPPCLPLASISKINQLRLLHCQSNVFQVLDWKLCRMIQQYFLAVFKVDFSKRRLVNNGEQVDLQSNLLSFLDVLPNNGSCISCLLLWFSPFRLIVNFGDIVASGKYCSISL